MVVLDQLVGVIVAPYAMDNVLLPCVAPKFVPVSVTELPTAAIAGDIPEIPGTTVKGTYGYELVVTPLAVTATLAGPSAMPPGAVILIVLSAQLIEVAGVPLSVTVPGVVPKFVP